jgi:hypothetical protein
MAVATAAARHGCLLLLEVNLHHGEGFNAPWWRPISPRRRSKAADSGARGRAAGPAPCRGARPRRWRFRRPRTTSRRSAFAGDAPRPGGAFPVRSRPRIAQAVARALRARGRAAGQHHGEASTRHGGEWRRHQGRRARRGAPPRAARCRRRAAPLDVSCRRGRTVAGGAIGRDAPNAGMVLSGASIKPGKPARRSTARRSPASRSMPATCRAPRRAVPRPVLGRRGPMGCFGIGNKHYRSLSCPISPRSVPKRWARPAP